MLLRIVALAVLIAVLLPGDPAGAVERDILSAETDAGVVCTVTATNGESVWPGNLLVVRSGSETVTVEGVEDAPNIFTTAEIVSDGIVTASVEYDEWSSLEAEVACEPVPVTTTTTEPPPPDTPPPSDCAVVRGGDCETTTTSSVPEDDPTTTTTVPPPETTTTAPPPDENCPPGGLACTGFSDQSGEWMLLGASSLVLLGASSVLLARRD